MSEPAGTSPGIVPNDVLLKESKQFDSEDGSDVVPEKV
jgi:hypothetical protein